MEWSGAVGQGQERGGRIIMSAGMPLFTVAEHNTTVSDCPATEISGEDWQKKFTHCVLARTKGAGQEDGPRGHQGKVRPLEGL